MKDIYTQANPAGNDIIYQHSGGSIQVNAVGTFDSATVNMYIIQDDIGTFTKLDDFSMTQNDVKLVDMKANTSYKFDITGAGPSANIEVSII